MYDEHRDELQNKETMEHGGWEPVNPEPEVQPEAQQQVQSEAQPEGWQQTQPQTQSEPVNQPQFDNQAPRNNAPRNNTYIPQEPVRTARKKPSMAGRIAGVTAAALLFGTVAGGTMFTVNTVGEYISDRYAPQIGQTETAGVTTGQAAGGDSEANTAGAAPVTTALQTDVSSIVERAMPSVVAINNTMLMKQETWFGPSQTVEVPSSGSGIIVGQNDEELLIVTNNHVVEDSKTLTVTFINDSQVAASIKGTDSDSDLAVIAVKLADIPSDAMSQIKVATLGDSDQLKVGQGVIAIGNALGYGQSVTVGYVSAKNREVKAEDSTTRNLLQTDAAINPGNSGGALLNMKGEVIGINAAKYSSTEVEGMGYAIPISQAQDIINELMNKKTRVAVDEKNQGYLGIQGQNIDETAATMYGMPRGIYVYKIIEGSAAAQSDLKEKDIITKFDGQSVRTMADLKNMLTYYEGGDTVNLTVQSLSDGTYQEHLVQIKLGTKPAAETN
ncbi:MAG: trypsin-like peptidase domain-containing protein [Lachnospiraceae bacterium]|nr:trypsin-like peptidase domain-containing protein [Lachnospiraceae bacterium]